MNVGGQAVIEGVMMRANRTVVSVRTPKGTIETEVLEKEPFVRKSKLSKIPFLRGIIVMVDTIVIGFKAIDVSARLSSTEDEKFTTKDFVFSILLALLIGIGMFVLGPMLAARFIVGRESSLFTLTEGLVRGAVFLIYLWVISLFRDVKRLFAYHGAEHKAVYTYESGEALSVKNARKHSTLHPRCGTTFLVLVILISIIVFSLADIIFGSSTLSRVLSRILLIPAIASLSYEVQKLSSRNVQHPISKLFLAPGLLTQLITTAQPADDQLEVSIAALKAALVDDNEEKQSQRGNQIEGEGKPTLQESEKVTETRVSDE